MIHAHVAKLGALGIAAAISWSVVAASDHQSGCNPKGAATSADIGQIVICAEGVIFAQVAAGQTTFEDIALAVSAQCGSITATEVENIISIWMGASDAGMLPYAVRDSKLAAKVADPQFQARLRLVHHKS
jgi:hypothetical protein